MLCEKHPVILVPMIWTTATIWTTNADLSQASIADGTLAEGDVPVQERPWVYYQYHQSPGLKHPLSPPPSEEDQIANILDREYIRTIPVVSATGISDFLKDFHGSYRPLHDSY